MKKLFLALLFSTVLFFGLPYLKVSAMPVTYDVPFSAVPDFVNMLNAILSGGEININGISSLEELQAEWNNSQLSTKNFLQRTAQSLFNQMVMAAGTGEQSLTGTGSTFIYKALPEDLAYFMDYNINWYKYANKPVDIEIPQPDADYINLITSINDTNFFWKNWANPNTTYPTYYSLSPMSAMSFFRKSPINDLNTNGFSNGIACSVQSIYISSIPNSNNYTFNFTIPIEYIFDGISNEFTANTSRQLLTRGNPVTTSPTYTYTGTIENCLKYLRSNSINITIYVDGVLWAKAGDIEIPEDFISAPDVISLGDLGLEIYDVFYPGNIDDYGGLSINGFIEWLKQQLGERTKIGLDDLIEDEVPIIITNDGTTKPIDYDNTRPVPIVIEEDIPYEPEPNPSVTPTTTPFPLPPFPKFPIPSDIPNANIQHTVLAEIVDATQSVVPDDLMVLIWSTFGLLVVGGLIYILHK